MQERKRSLSVKVQQAAMWLPKVTQPDQLPDGRQQQQQQQQVQDRPFQRNISGGDNAQHRTGYVNICGIALPCKTLDASSILAAPAGHSLIYTAAVDDNLKAAALALCQTRPLLLEGPPGQLQPNLLMCSFSCILISASLHSLHSLHALCIHCIHCIHCILCILCCTLILAMRRLQTRRVYLSCWIRSLFVHHVSTHLWYEGSQALFPALLRVAMHFAALSQPCITFLRQLQDYAQLGWQYKWSTPDSLHVLKPALSPAHAQAGL